VNDLLWKKKLILEGQVNNMESTSNRTLIEYTIEYVSTCNKNKDMLKQINFVRLKRRYFYHVK